jgi:hypothetical protein
MLRPNQATAGYYCCCGLFKIAVCQPHEQLSSHCAILENAKFRLALSSGPPLIEPVLPMTKDRRAVISRVFRLHS